ncbi:response regulator containing CheY-like receiver domain and AraC-type DNA-binding domain [Brachybacterium faecium DSM 4810]|uniref:Response regulator containing CheY-like receiver domain and AraC-type DNA-binding domain n=1 Tax=Brachybacterium faecium (strain ATCC 43885 / DSM 4810 / JCM 11609 / LMG 19847 / NBRC 14762 / NCIMB 9860 / 6-10) TaxID=446465 RepID=C7MHG0_BRAFD|nr:helix-turn-helix domain-containing protein [Brachybacterium faecium]ACU84369.1 response regulator containing CheY-like receiver domain and AraC-type DNA-binding domain [Brachybacterium faecium DSM 4810]
MTQWPLSDAVEDMPPGLWIRRGAPPPMFSMHRHDDVEINLVLDGQLHYLFGGQPLTIREGEIAVFWAAQPHGLVDSRTGDMCWLHVPFSMFLAWGLPEAQTAPLLSAQPLITHAPDLARRIAHMAERWGEEVGGAEPGGGTGAAGGADGSSRGDDESTEIALLEIQAAMRRVLRASSRANPEAPSDGGGSVPAARLRQVSTMAQYVRDHHRSPVTVADIAASVHLAPSHAMTVFRRTAGVTLGDYVTMCRVAEAQRLLLTTSLKVTEIAEEAGFGSLSSFYEHVSAACGMTPREYRRQRR